MTHKRITLPILGFLALNTVLETSAQIFFKKTADFQGHFHINGSYDILLFMWNALFCPYLWFAFFAVFLTFTNWSTILSKIDLSMAIPLGSLSYVLVSLAAIIFLHEKINFLQWMGVIVILIGVSLVSSSTSQRKT